MSEQLTRRRLCGSENCDSEAKAVVYLRNSGSVLIRPDHLDLPDDHFLNPTAHARCFDCLFTDIEEHVEPEHERRVDRHFEQV